MPSIDSGGVENMWYSFDYGLVHFVMLDSETDYKFSPEGPLSQVGAGPFGDQMGWLKDDLKKATSNRQTTPWIVAVAHRYTLTFSPPHFSFSCFPSTFSSFILILFSSFLFSFSALCTAVRRVTSLLMLSGTGGTLLSKRCTKTMWIFTFLGMSIHMSVSSQFIM